MNLLAVDTSTRWAGVGLMTDSGEQSQTTWRSDQNHGRELMPAIVDLLGRASLKPGDVTYLAVALGPGGFSAVRVGISTVIGLALPHNTPVVGISTHAVEAFPFIESASSSSPVISMLPGGRGEIAWARFHQQEPEPTEIGLSTVEEFTASLKSGDRLCGEGTSLVRDHVESERILSGDEPTRSPISLLDIAAAKIANGETTLIDELRPIYARPPSISMPRKPA